MDTIGNKILELRKQKGLTQAELSDMSQINLRTLQRIEKGNSQPRGNTLKNLCTALNISMEDILDYGKNSDPTFLRIFHLSVLSFIVIPFGNLILPWVIWVTKRDKIAGLNEQWIAILKFQIAWTWVFNFFFFSFHKTRRRKPW